MVNQFIVTYFRKNKTLRQRISYDIELHFIMNRNLSVTKILHNSNNLYIMQSQNDLFIYIYLFMYRLNPSLPLCSY